jgi:NAD(P)-dependent dehydrogenase (short-subunit alcohol dehydrogenase family)
LQLQGRTFIVTGGASGLGAACVKRIAGAGGRAMIVDRDETAAKSLIQSWPESVRFTRADVTDEVAVHSAIQESITWSGDDGLRGAVNCAGIIVGEKLVGKDGPHSLDGFLRVIQVNLVGTFNVCRLAADAMAQNTPDENGERGVLINTSSISAFEGQIGQVAYAASKGGVASMTLPMARDLSRNGIRVVAIAPGVFETAMVAGISDKVRESLVQQTVFPTRLGRPDEFAALVQHIIENPMLNGCVMRLDGAVRLATR